MKTISRILIVLFAVLFVGCKSEKRPLPTLAQVPSSYLSVNDSVTVHYKSSVPADMSKVTKTICFVHGFGCDVNTWARQYEAFCADNTLRLLFIDLPGYGLSSKPKAQYTLDFFADAVTAVLDEVNADTTVLVGHSLGTPVCRQVLTKWKHPSRLVDVDGVYCFYDESTTPEYEKAISDFSHAFDGPSCSEVIKGFVQSLAGPSTPDSITAYAMTVMPETPVYVASSTMHNLVERKWWNSPERQCPVLVVCTQNSGLDADNKQKMERMYPDLEYNELTVCGHFIHMERPEWFNDKLKAFVAR